MNIFVLSESPKEAAKFHLSKHVVKMPLETAQMLSSVYHRYGLVGDSVSQEDLYKQAHKNHPCTLWAGDSKENFKWLCNLGFHLLNEYNFRYGKHHASGRVIANALKNLDKIDFDKSGATDFALAMPDECKVGSAVESYREYYREEKSKIAVWNGKVNNREMPFWY